MLTRKQSDLLHFIERHQAEQGGVSLTYNDMRDALRLKSKSGIHRLITGLEERGFIRRIPGRARAVEVLRRHRTSAEELEKLAWAVATEEGPAKAAQALVDLAIKIMPAP